MNSYIGKKYICYVSYEAICIEKKVVIDFDLKGMTFEITGIERACGLYLICKAENGYSFAILPEEINKFVELNPIT